MNTVTTLVSRSRENVQSNQESVASVVDFNAFKARKDLGGERKAGVVASFKPQSSESSKSAATAQDPDLSERIERIKSSINRINHLMTELRTISQPEANGPRKV